MVQINPKVWIMQVYVHLYIHTTYAWHFAEPYSCKMRVLQDTKKVIKQKMKG